MYLGAFKYLMKNLKMEINTKNTLKLLLLFLIWRHEISAA